MSETSSRVRLMANLQAAVAEAVSGTMEERGRGFASDREAWAELSLLFKAPRLCRPLYRLQIDHDDARPLPDFRSQQLHRLAPIFDRPYRLFTGRDRYRALVLAQ